MSWVSLGSFHLTQDWQFTLSVTGEIFRIKHLPVIKAENTYLKGVIASVFVDEYKEVNVYEPKRLTYREEKEIFTFFYPSQISNVNLIGFKRLDKNTNIDWIIEAEVYQADNQAGDFDNYLLTRFGDVLMYLINRSGGSSIVSPNSDNFGAKVATVDRLLQSNVGRKHLVIRAADRPVNLYAVKKPDGSPDKFIERVNAGEIFLLPNVGGIYTGEVFVQAIGGDTTISYTEYA